MADIINYSDHFSLLTTLETVLIIFRAQKWNRCKHFYDRCQVAKSGLLQGRLQHAQLVCSMSNTGTKTLFASYDRRDQGILPISLSSWQCIWRRNKDEISMSWWKSNNSPPEREEPNSTRFSDQQTEINKADLMWNNLQMTLHSSHHIGKHIVSSPSVWRPAPLTRVM